MLRCVSELGLKGWIEGMNCLPVTVIGIDSGPGNNTALSERRTGSERFDMMAQRLDISISTSIFRNKGKAHRSFWDPSDWESIIVTRRSFKHSIFDIAFKDLTNSFQSSSTSDQVSIIVKDFTLCGKMISSKGTYASIMISRQCVADDKSRNLKEGLNKGSSGRSTTEVLEVLEIPFQSRLNDDNRVKGRRESRADNTARIDRVRHWMLLNWSP